MAKKEEDKTEQEPLTEEQRISALEAKVGTNKIVLLGMALFLIVAVSVSSTFFIVSLFSEEKTEGESETVIALQTKITELEKNLETLQKTSKTARNELALLKEKVANSGNLKLQQIIIEQEKGHQTFLDALRSGMYDLAHMLPGSRTWLEVYGEKVDKAEMLSKDREKALINIQKGKASEVQAQEDPFAEGF